VIEASDPLFGINQTTVYERSHQPTASSKDRVRKGRVGISVLVMMLRSRVFAKFRSV
jgi:hypothetical protein